MSHHHNADKHAKQYTIKSNGSNIYYWVYEGKNEKPLVALTHGASLDHRMFDAQVTALQDAGYPVLTWDVRGHGKSKPIGDHFSVQTAAEDLLAILNELETEKVILVGHSFGGYISQHITFLQPERVAAVAVIGSTDITEVPPFGKRLLFQSLPMVLRLIPDKPLRKQYADKMGVTRSVKEYALNATGLLSRDEFISAYAGAVKAICDEAGYGTSYHISRPFLLTHGDEDAVDGGMAKGSSAWAKREPNCRYEVIPDAGHNANQDNPAYFNQVLLDFIVKQ